MLQASLKIYNCSLLTMKLYWKKKKRFSICRNLPHENIIQDFLIRSVIFIRLNSSMCGTLCFRCSKTVFEFCIIAYIVVIMHLMEIYSTLWSGNGTWRTNIYLPSIWIHSTFFFGSTTTLRFSVSYTRWQHIE